MKPRIALIAIALTATALADVRPEPFDGGPGSMVLAGVLISLGFAVWGYRKLRKRD